MIIKTNKVQCRNCNDVIESKYTHNFKVCSCRSVAVDGGKTYLKRSYTDRNCYEELSETVGEAYIGAEQHSDGLEIVLKVEDGVSEDLISKAKNVMDIIKADAFANGRLISELEFTPYLAQNYRYTLKVDSDYDTDTLEDLVDELKEFDTFKVGMFKGL